MFGRAGINIIMRKFELEEKTMGSQAVWRDCPFIDALSGACFIYMIDLLFTETKNVP